LLECDLELLQFTIGITLISDVKRLMNTM
jgi:hypothetical protein